MKRTRGKSLSTTVSGLIGGSCLAVLGAGPEIAMAQDEAPAQSTATAEREESSGEVIQTVVVTTRYIREDIQTTPMAVTAQTSAQLEAANVPSISRLGAVVPNLWTVPGDSQSAGTPRISMRGVQQGASSSLAVPPAVAIYTDDVYHATTAGSELDLLDIERVEVNRGPQSTLSGNASIGGSIKIYSKDPVGDGSGYVSYGRGSYNRQEARAAIDLGLTETLAVRLSGYYNNKDGYVDRLDFTCQMNKQGTPELAGNFPSVRPNSNNQDCVIGKLGGGTTSIAQAKLRWRPNEDVDLLLTVRKRDENLEETPEVALLYQPNPVPNPNSAVEDYNAAVRDAFGIQLDSRFMAPPGTDGYATYATNCRPNLDLTPPAGFIAPSGFCYPQGKTADHQLISAKLNYSLAENVQMTAILAHTQYSNNFTQNGDQSPLGYVISNFENIGRQRTAELRFSGSALEDRLAWIVGGFYLRLTGHQNNFIGVLLNGQIPTDTGKIDSQSGFFHLDYNLTDRWRVSGGARYTEGGLKYYFNHPPVLVIPDPIESSYDRVDWLISTDYKFSDNLMAYASAATGSRPPGVTTIVNTARQLAPTPDEELVAYELGLKSEWFNHRLRANLAAFYTDYESLSAPFRGFECLGQPNPATVFNDPSECAQFAPNTGSLQWNISVGIPARITGLELELSAVPIDGLRFNLSGGYNHFHSGIRTPGEPGYMWPGNHRQPNVNLHADVSYDIETSIGTFTPRVDWAWQSQQDWDPSPSLRPPLPIYIIDPFSLWNAQVDYTSNSGDWSATLAVTNVSDKFYYHQVLLGLLNAQTRVGEPRQWLFTVRRNF